jgi:MoaE-MoaD fusion protein
MDRMRIELRYFAVLREMLGRAEEGREVEDGSTVGDVFGLLEREEPRLGPLRGSILLMVNQEYATPDAALRDGDEVALIPPVSGGAGQARLFRVQEEPVDARMVEAVVADAAAGAMVAFTGTVRDHARGRPVTALEYEAYGPAAEKMLARIGDEIAARWGIERVAIVHRTGRLAVGEASVAIAVASAHRGEAFAACAYAIERLKEIVPIWKKEHYAGGAVWIGSEAEYRREIGGAEGRATGGPPEPDRATGAAG